MAKNGLAEFEKAIAKISVAGSDPKYITQAGNVALNATKMLCSGFRVSSGELRNSIGMTIVQEGNGASAHIGTNKQYAGYVEFGTGPKGMANHAGTSPEVAVAYTPAPWWIHESQIDPDVPAVYGWPYIETEQGRFYKCSGQPAHPYLYPAVHDNEEMLTDILAGGFKEAMK